MTQPHEGGVAAQSSSPSSTPSQQAKPAPTVPVLTANTHTPRDDRPTEQSGHWPISAEWALVIVTAVLAWFTFWLWNATRKLVTEAKETAKRQLRAYVHVADIQTHEKPVSLASFPSLEVRIKNFGQTPAYRLRIESTSMIDLARVPTKLALPVTLTSGSRHTVGPGGKLKHYSDPLTPTPLELAGLKSGELRFYLFGLIQYTDAFGDLRWESFRSSLNANNFLLEIESEGNESSVEPQKPK